MVDHDKPAAGDRDSEGDDERSSEPIGPRRSTWTPPPSQPAGPSDATSDDDLASALAEDFGRATHAEPSDIPDAWDEALGVSEGAAGASEEDQAADGDAPVAEEAAPTTDEEVPDDAVPDFVSPQDVPPGPEAPVDDMTSGPPVRRSMPMSELAAVLAEQTEHGSGNSGDIMSQLEEQLTLREQDAAEFARWQEGVLASGDANAIDEVESARSAFSDLFSNSAPAPSPAPSPAQTTQGPAETSPPESAPEATPDSAANPIHGGDDSTHTFRMDEVLDSDLISAPAPMTAPLTDIPPPPGHEIAAPKATDIPPMPPSIPDLVEPAPTPSTSPGAFDFDSLLSGAVPDEEPTVFSADALSSSDESGGADPGFADSGVTGPGSLRDDDVADTDQVFSEISGPFPVTSDGIATVPEPAAAPIEPLPSRQTATSPSMPTPSEGMPTHEEGARRHPAAFRVEEISVEPTATDQRVGRAARLFWLWFAANSSVISVAFGGAIFALGMSLRQAIVATVVGVVVSFLPLGLGSLAGRLSGQPTMIASRAAFGHLGNVLPAILALLVRVFWGAVLLWFLAAGTSRILIGAKLAGPLGETQVTIIGLAAGFLVALVIAFFGYGLIARLQLVITIVAAILIVGLIVITWPAVDITEALTVGDGPWILVVTGAVLVFSFVGLAWAVSSADLARYQRPGTTRTGTVAWSTLGAALPAFVLIAYGAVLAASDPGVATGLVETPLDTIALLIPIWYPVPLIAALVLSLLSGVVLSIYSAGFALHSTGARMRRPAAVIVVSVAVAAAAILVSVSADQLSPILRDLATSLAVPIAAWAGIFGANMAIRTRALDSRALLKRGGTYSDVNWVNLGMLVVASVIGFGLTSATVEWLAWQGYLFNALGVPLSSDLAGSDLGVFVALILGVLTPIVAGIPSVRRQERGAK